QNQRPNHHRSPNHATAMARALPADAATKRSPNAPAAATDVASTAVTATAVTASGRQVEPEAFRIGGVTEIVERDLFATGDVHDRGDRHRFRLVIGVEGRVRRERMVVKRSEAERDGDGPIAPRVTVMVEAGAVEGLDVFGGDDQDRTDLDDVTGSEIDRREHPVAVN